MKIASGQLILTIFIIAILFALAAMCKAAMDTRTFQSSDVAFMHCPAWFRSWMQHRGRIPIIKIDDGWHAMQMIMFLFTGAAFMLAGMLWCDLEYCILLVFVLRGIVHGIVFELLYPMM